MKKILKIILSCALVIFILRFIEAGEVAKTIQLLSWGELCFIVGFYIFGQLLSTWKWQLINYQLALKASYYQTAQAYFTGMFVNSYGLGLVGGDVARALMIAPEAQKIRSLAGVFIDRLHGMLILGLIGCFSFPFLNYHLPHNSELTLLPFLVSLPLISAIWLFFPQILSYIIPKRKMLGHKIEPALLYFQGRKSHLLQISLLSLSFHLGQIFLMYLIAQFLHIEVAFLKLLVIIPFINIITSLPFSWNGLGVREAALIYFLGDFISNEQAVTLGVVWIVAVTIASLLGGVVSLLNKRVRHQR